MKQKGRNLLGEKNLKALTKQGSQKGCLLLKEIILLVAKPHQKEVPEVEVGL